MADQAQQYLDNDGIIDPNLGGIGRLRQDHTRLSLLQLALPNRPIDMQVQIQTGDLFTSNFLLAYCLQQQHLNRIAVRDQRPWWYDSQTVGGTHRTQHPGALVGEGSGLQTER